MRPAKPVKIETEAELRAMADKPTFYRRRIVTWDGPGWYFERPDSLSKTMGG